MVAPEAGRGGNPGNNNTGRRGHNQRRDLRHNGISHGQQRKPFRRLDKGHVMFQDSCQSTEDIDEKIIMRAAGIPRTNLLAPSMDP